MSILNTEAMFVGKAKLRLLGIFQCGARVKVKVNTCSLFMNITMTRVTEYEFVEWKGPLWRVILRSEKSFSWVFKLLSRFLIKLLHYLPKIILQECSFYNFTWVGQFCFTSTRQICETPCCFYLLRNVKRQKQEC